jgi:hypothetical protein
MEVKMADNENRKKRRIPVIASAFVVHPSPVKGPVEGYIVNISYGGLGLYFKEPLEGRVQVAISIGMDEEKPVAELVWGQVCWKGRLPGSSWVIGISFEGLNPKDHGRLLSYLDEYISESSRQIPK